jgi:hypothetical protein
VNASELGRVAFAAKTPLAWWCFLWCGLTCDVGAVGCCVVVGCDAAVVVTVAVVVVAAVVAAATDWAAGIELVVVAGEVVLVVGVVGQLSSQSWSPPTFPWSSLFGAHVGVLPQ